MMTGIKINLKNLSLNGLINTTENVSLENVWNKENASNQNFTQFRLLSHTKRVLQFIAWILSNTARKQKINSKMNLDETAVEKCFL